MIGRNLRGFVCLLAFVFIWTPFVFADTPGKHAQFQSRSSAKEVAPTLRNLSQITQRRPQEIPSETSLNANEQDMMPIEASGNRQVPDRYLPHHSFQQDRPASSWKTATTPSVKATFPGIPSGLKVQPDSNIAVGPTAVMLAINTSLAVYSKTGQKKFVTTFESWFSSLKESTDAVLFDPRLVYDPDQGGHFIFTCAARGGRNSWILMSVSKTSDPRGSWAFWALDMQLNGDFRTDLWADFPRLGLDQKGIYLTADMTRFVSFKTRYAKIRILNKAKVYSFQKIGWHDFWELVDGSDNYAIHIEPAQTFGPAPAEYLVNTNFDSGNVITLWTITGANSSTPQLSKTPIPVSTYHAPPFAAQKGGGALLVTATEGTGALKVVSRGGFVYASHAIAHNWGSRNVSAIRFYQMDTTGHLVQETTYGSDGLWYYMPAVMVNSAGDVVLAFSLSGKSQYAGFYFAGRRATDPPGIFSNSVALQPGLANYELTFKTNDQVARWGDYNGIALDPDDSFWIYGEFATSTTEFGTQVGRLTYNTK